MAVPSRTRTVRVRIASCLTEKIAKSHNFERHADKSTTLAELQAFPLLDGIGPERVAWFER